MKVMVVKEEVYTQGSLETDSVPCLWCVGLRGLALGQKPSLWFSWKGMCEACEDGLELAVLNNFSSFFVFSALLFSLLLPLFFIPSIFYTPRPNQNEAL